MQTCLEYSVKWRPGKELGRGFFGRVYELSNDGDYVMKLIKLGDDDYETETEWQPASSDDAFKNEILMQNKFSSYGLAVPIVDSWICDKDFGVIVMKKLWQPLSKYLQEHPRYDKDRIISALRKLIGIHRRHRISHGDFKLENIMIDPIKHHENAISLDIDGSIFYLYLIDFAFAAEGDKFDHKIDIEALEKIKVDL